MDVSLATSDFPPLALGFFGLGTGYLIYGPQELFGYPNRDESVDRATGVWGIFMPGLCQLVTGLTLFDDHGVDGVVEGTALGVGGTGSVLRLTQTGFVRSYALSLLVGVVIVVVALLAVNAA